MIIQIGPVIVALLAVPLFGERLHGWLLGGMLVGFAGVAVIARGLDRPTPARACSASCSSLVAAAMYAVGVLTQKVLLRRIPSVQVVFVSFLMGAVTCLPFAGDLPAIVADGGAELWWIVYLGVLPTAVAFTTWAYALTHTDAGALSLTTFLVPLIATLIAWLAHRRGAAVADVRRRRAGDRRRADDAAQAEGRLTQRLGVEASSQPRKASRLRVDSPREMRHSHSLRIDGGEAELEDGVERLVGVGQHGAEDPVELVVVHRCQRQPRLEVDVAVAVDGEGDGVHPQVALEQPPVDAGVVLVGVAAHEGVDAEGVRADVEADRRLELALAREGQRDARSLDALARGHLVLDLVVDEVGADARRRRSCASSHHVTR